MQTDVLFYKNAVYGTIVIDLRPRINLGGGLFHDNSMWYDLTGRSSHYQALFRDYQHDQDSPFLLYTNCCGSLVYLVVPELVQHCPLCGCFVSFFGWSFRHGLLPYNKYHIYRIYVYFLLQHMDLT